MEQVGRTLCIPVDQRVHEALGGSGWAARAAQKQEAADGRGGDAGAADPQHLPAAQPGDHLVVAGLAVLSLLCLAVLLGLALLWRRPATLARCLSLWLSLSGLSLPGLTALWLALVGLALSGLATLWLTLSGLTLSGLALSGLAASRLPTLCSALLWLAAAGVAALWLALSGLALSGLSLLWLPAPLWLAALWLSPLLLLATPGVVVLYALAAFAVTLAALLFTRNISAK